MLSAFEAVKIFITKLVKVKKKKAKENSQHQNQHKFRTTNFSRERFFEIKALKTQYYFTHFECSNKTCKNKKLNLEFPFFGNQKF